MMKKLYILLAVFCFASCSKIEIEEIVVNNKKMRERLIFMYDTNKDGILSKAEALKVTMIDVNWSDEPIDCLENFPNLEALFITNCECESIDLSKNAKLTNLTCWYNKLKTLDLTNNPELQGLTCADAELESISLGYHPKLVWLHCGKNKLTSLDFSGCDNLTRLTCYNNLLTELDVNHNSKLETLDCNRNQLETIDVSANLRLWSLECQNNPNMTTAYLKAGQTILMFIKDPHTAVVYL